MGAALLGRVVSADVLRRAAALMRERAQAATPGPWVRSGSSIETDHECSPGHGCWPVGDTYSGTMPDGSKQPASLIRADAEHIASWHPAVALTVADWLEAEAKFCDESPFYADLDTDDERADFLEKPLAVARAYLAESR